MLHQHQTLTGLKSHSYMYFDIGLHKQPLLLSFWDNPLSHSF